MMRKALSIIVLAFFCLGASAQIIRDTSALRSSFKAAQLIAPAVLGASGAFVHYVWHDNIELPCRSFLSAGENRNRYIYVSGDYLRFAPATVHFGLGLTGVKSQHALLDRTIESAISH
ncbi:MAG: hypothetical protein IKH11_08840, partial [Bacteroidales bacterium]|nr:hypothetical protein [Bacteroidales bacterium]